MDDPLPGHITLKPEAVPFLAGNTSAGALQLYLQSIFSSESVFF
jgi:hypothetical protein